MRATLAIVLALGISDCQRAADPGTTRAELPLSGVVILGALGEPALIEASGIAASEAHAGVFWSQNDSGNSADLFAYDSSGRSLGITRVKGASNRDWEALALGPCASGTCIYIGDVGDNHAQRSYVTVYRVAEPTPGDSVTAPADSVRIRFPDGPRDVESMWVAPDTGVWLLSKRPLFAPGGRPRPAQLYRVPPSAWTSTDTQVATHVDSLPLVPLASSDRTWITDAALSPADHLGQRRLAVRTYRSVHVFAVDSVSGHPGAQEQSCALDAIHQRQGEGVTWLRDGRLLFNAEGRGARLTAGRCP